ncbi:hypothetical protein FHR88_000473 [Bradyrhizobium betae]|nr:hypothetical protein [Bradyrhizobium betae]
MSFPAKAGNPVRRDFSVNHDCLGLLDRPVKPDDDSVRAEEETQPYAALPFASWIARHTRSGVSGMSMCLMP